MAKIHVDGQAFEVDGSQNLLHTCLSLGFDLEYFCWHPALGSVGACRQCAVKQFKDETDERAGKGKIVMACMTPAADGTRISIRDPEAVAFRAGIIEGLMLNHPHDCPVCDEGGECHLQDMTVMTGHSYRRNRFAKRTFRNQQLGPCLNHEMNRCIQCYRCVRFYREYAGGRDLDVFGLRNLTYFGRAEDGTLESEWSGNLAEVCPTGVFTDATLGRHYVRKWDQQMSPSVCGHCGLGCNITHAQRAGQLRRTVNRYNGQVNGYFICDRGRYAYEFAQSDARLRSASVSDDEIIARLARVADERTIGIGSPRASLEANFALRALVGRDHFFMGMADSEATLMALALDLARRSSARVPTIAEASQSDAVLILGEDLPNVAPRLALAVRQAVRQRSFEHARRHHIPVWLDQAVRTLARDELSPLYVFTPFATRLDDVATIAGRVAPDDVACLGFAVAHVIDASLPAVSDLNPAQRCQAEDIARSLLAAQRPLVISGPSLGCDAVMRAAAAVAQALCNQGRAAALAFTAPECNSVGAALFGAGRLVAAFERVAIGATRVVILENDLYRRAPASEVDKLFERAGEVIVLDCIRSRTSERATIAVPSATRAESDGTLVSSETRAQRFFQVMPPAAPLRASWRWLAQALAKAGRADWQTLDQIIAALAADIPALAPIVHAAPSAEFRLDGAKIPRAPHRESGRTAESANIQVQDRPPPSDPDSALAFSMEGTTRQPPASLVPFFWSPAWNSVQAVNKFQEEIAGPLRGGDAGVRLIDGMKDGGFDPGGPPPPFSLRPGQLWAMPHFQIFGSDELARHAPAVAARTPPAALTVHPEDGVALRVLAGDVVDVRSETETARLTVVFSESVARGTAAMSAGHPETLRLPTWIRILRP